MSSRNIFVKTISSSIRLLFIIHPSNPTRISPTTRSRLPPPLSALPPPSPPSIASSPYFSHTSEATPAPPAQRSAQSCTALVCTPCRNRGSKMSQPLQAHPRDPYDRSDARTTRRLSPRRQQTIHQRTITGSKVAPSRDRWCVTDGSSRRMDEVARSTHHVKVHDVRHTLDVEATRRNIRSKHQRLLARDERSEGLITLMLLLVTVDRNRAKLCEVPRADIHPTLCVGEDNHCDHTHSVRKGLETASNGRLRRGLTARALRQRLQEVVHLEILLVVPRLDERLAHRRVGLELRIGRRADEDPCNQKK